MIKSSFYLVPGNTIKLYKLCGGIFVVWLCCVQSTFAQVSNSEGLSPIDGVVISKVQTSQQQAVKRGAVFKDCDYCPEMVLIPAGQFFMGASREDELENLPKESRPNNQPQHSVELVRFAIGKFPVTRSQYGVFVNATDRRSDGCQVWIGSQWEKDLPKDWRNPGFIQDERHPVTCVSWDDASAYVEWLTQKTGKRYRLLSEAEWEYSARAGTTTSRYWGNDGNLSCAYANGADKTAKAQVLGAGSWTVANCTDNYAYTAPVGSFQSNLFGLYDMLGNVSQWTQDCWNDNYLGAPADGNPWIIGNCRARVVRGASWLGYPREMRSSYRWALPLAYRSFTIGFRVALTIDSSHQDFNPHDTLNQALERISSPSASYIGRLRAKIKPNITFTDNFLQTVVGNPSADVEVTCSPSGKIESVDLVKSSGNSAWDEAVLNGLRKTAMLPRDVEGSVSIRIVLSFRPRD